MKNNRTLADLQKSVADPGFPVGGAVDPRGGYVSKILHVKTKESGPVGGACPLDPPMEIHNELKYMVNQRLKLSTADSHWFTIDSYWFANMQIVRINANHVNPREPLCKSSWCIHSWKEEILNFKMVPCLWKSVKNWGHRSYLNIHTKFNPNQWESGFRLIWESTRINSRLIWKSSRISENHQESARIIENQWESMRIRI